MIDSAHEKWHAAEKRSEITLASRRSQTEHPRAVGANPHIQLVVHFHAEYRLAVNNCRVPWPEEARLFAFGMNRHMEAKLWIALALAALAAVCSVALAIVHCCMQALRLHPLWQQG